MLLKYDLKIHDRKGQGTPKISRNIMHRFLEWYSITTICTQETVWMWKTIHTLHFTVVIWYQGPLLLTWVDSNLHMDKQSQAQLSVGWNYLSFPKLQRLHHWSLGMDKYFHPTIYNECNYLLIHAEIKVKPCFEQHIPWPSTDSLPGDNNATTGDDQTRSTTLPIYLF